MQVTLPWPQAVLSPNGRHHWSKVARAKKLLREACYVLAMDAGIRPGKFRAPVLVSMTFVPPTKASVDIDNAIARSKALIDGLADALGVDDKHFTLLVEMKQGPGGMVKVEVTQL